MTDRMEALEGNLVVLEQAVGVLNRLDDRTYAVGGAHGDRSAIGVHFRHVFDHYHAFLRGLASDEIDYDQRQRQVPLEQDRRLALAAAHGLIADLSRLPPELADREVRVTVRSMTSCEGSPDWSRSTLKRELQFLVSHTVHHYALIKELLRLEGFEAGEEFGVAPSTLAANRTAPACAR